MNYQSNIAIGASMPGMPLPFHKAAILQEEPLDNLDALDGSAAAMSQFLQDMADLVGDNASAPDSLSRVPVLTLQFGEVVTATSLSTSGDHPCLSITALLPRDDQPVELALACEQPATPGIEGGQNQVLWDADEGRYVLTRKIPIAQLPDERSVLDAILDASDAAKIWFASVTARREPR
jgi:hypothetical protein